MFHAILATDLNQRGAASLEQLYFRLSWFLLPFTKEEIRQLVDSARRHGVVDRLEEGANADGNTINSDAWCTTEYGRGVKRPQAMSLRDVAQWATGNKEQLSSLVSSARAATLTLVPYLALIGLGISKTRQVATIATLVAGLVVLVACLSEGVVGDWRLRAAAQSWPRFRELRRARYDYQTNVLRILFLPGTLVVVYATAGTSLVVDDSRLIIAAGCEVVLSIVVSVGFLRRLRTAWDGDDEDIAKWRKEWRRRGTPPA